MSRDCQSAQELSKHAADTNLHILCAKTVAGDGNLVAGTGTRRLNSNDPSGIGRPRCLPEELPNGDALPRADAQGMLNRPSSKDEKDNKSLDKHPANGRHFQRRKKPRSTRV